MLPKLTAWPKHPVYAATAAAKGKAKRDSLAPAETKPKLGKLPEWNLADLYKAPDAPELKADLASSESAADAMQSRYAGKLAKLLDGGKGGAEIAEAVREYEALNDIMGRIVSYASLLYAADTSDPKRQKFFGDIQEKITRTALIFVGRVFGEMKFGDSKLYASNFAHVLRNAGKKKLRAGA